MLEKLESCDVEGLMKEHELQQKLEEEDEENDYHRNKNTYMVETSWVYVKCGIQNTVCPKYVHIVDNKDNIFFLTSLNWFINIFSFCCQIKLTKH